LTVDPFQDELAFSFDNMEFEKALSVDNDGRVYGTVDSRDVRQYWVIFPVDGAKAFYLSNNATGHVLEAGNLEQCNSSTTSLCGVVRADRSFTNSPSQKWNFF
jgi:hypothetical protein